MTETALPRAAIYARYSSELQNPRSIEDQVRLCREFAASRGFQVVAEYTDAAMSVASADRPQFEAMMLAARAGQFDIVVAEALDRLSRDLEDTARMKKHLDFSEVGVTTYTEGDINLMHIGFKGVQNAQFLKDMAIKVRRGQRGRIEKGRAAGGICYGYRVVKKLGADGEIERGLREVDPDQAKIVLRVFREVAEGKSPVHVAKGLNRDGIKPLRGKLWRASTLSGHKSRGIGMLCNELYLGKLLYNRVRQVRDPLKGGTVDKINPKATWASSEVPHLRIVPQDLWDRVQRLQRHLAQKPVHARRRARHMLSGLVYCATCGDPYIIISDDRMGCSKHRDDGGCDNHRRISRHELETRTIDGLRDRLLNEDMVAVFIEEWNRLEREGRAAVTAGRADDEKALKDINLQIDRIVKAISEGTPSRALNGRLAELEAQQEAIQDRLADLPRTGATILTMPLQAVALYRETIEGLAGILADPGAQGDARETARSDIRQMIDRIEISPGSGRTSKAILYAKAEEVFNFTGELGPDTPVPGLLMASPPGRRQYFGLPRLVVNI